MPRVPRMAIRTESQDSGSGPLPDGRGSVLNEELILEELGVRHRLILSPGALGEFRRGLADRLVVEPGGDVVVVDAAPPHDFLALGQNALVVPDQEPEGLERGLLA